MIYKDLVPGDALIFRGDAMWLALSVTHRTDHDGYDRTRVLWLKLWVKKDTSWRTDTTWVEDTLSDTELDYCDGDEVVQTVRE